MSCIIKRILQLSIAINYNPIKIVNIYGKDVSEECLYSWSSDKVCWTNWGTIYDYNRICKNIDGDFYLKIKINDDFDKLLIDNNLTTCYNISVDDSNIFLQNFCEDPNLFQPYNNLDCAIQLQQQLSDSIICMFGLPVYYFQINPHTETKDYTFKEYLLYYVNSVKQIKLMISDGVLPSSNPKLNMIDFDWETDWETEISKTQFANAFGDDVFPKSGDFLYIPLMKRMWQINSAYDEKNEGLMWRTPTWKVSLVKYEDDTIIDSGIYTDLIDGWVNMYEDEFGKYERNEQASQTSMQQIEKPSHVATNTTNIFMEDSIRNNFSKLDIQILNKTYNHKSAICGHNIYSFINENGYIDYQKPICGDNGTIIFIIETNKIPNTKSTYNILKFGEIMIDIEWDNESFNIKYNGMTHKLEPFKTYLCHFKWNHNTFNTEMCIYNYTHPTELPAYKLRPDMYSFDFENPVGEYMNVYNNDYDMRSPMKCSLTAYPFNITNIKYYNTYLDTTEAIKESIKYTTKHNNCIINDVARPLTDGHGYAVK